MAKRIASSVYNDFPDEILTHIISFLPIKEAVRTSILSRRWRYLFSLISNFDLKMDSSDGEEWMRFTEFLDRLLFFLDRPSIGRFRLRCNGLFDPQKVGVWMRALVWHKIQELELRTDIKMWDGFQLPQNLFSCESLVVLKLCLRKQSYELKVPARVCLPHLKVLRLEAIGLPNDGSEERLFSSCSVLENLGLCNCWFSRGCVEFKISNQTLRILKMHAITSKEGRSVPILINAPNLFSLGYSNSTSHSLNLVDAKPLSKAGLWFQRDGRGYGTGALSALSQIQNTRLLLMHYDILRDLQQSELAIPLLCQITSLTISGWEHGVDPVCLLYFLARCVVLKTLEFELPPCDISNPQPSQSFHWDPIQQHSSVENSQLAPLLCHLKTIYIQSLDLERSRVLMPVIEFFLKNANVLEKLEFTCKECSSEQRAEIMRKLTRIHRASNKCEVLFWKFA